MTLDRRYVLRPWGGGYLTADGMTTADRGRAVRLTFADADRVLRCNRPLRYRYDDVLWGCSIEECPKRGPNERRRFPPAPTATVDALIEAVRGQYRAKLASQAREHARHAAAMAVYYRALAGQTDPLPEPLPGKRAIELEP